jgi:hypothetical protein
MTDQIFQKSDLCTQWVRPMGVYVVLSSKLYPEVTWHNNALERLVYFSLVSCYTKG